MNTKFITLLTCLIILSANVFSQNGKWKKARKINTLETYEEFLEKYPDSKYKYSAFELIDSINFYKIDLKDLSELRTYILNAKSDKYKGKTKTVIEQLENELWHEVKSINTNQGYQKYLENFPNGKYTDNANQNIDSLYWNNYVYNSSNSLNYISYLKKFPEGRYVNEANNYLKTPIYKARNQIDNFNRAFEKEVKFTDEQVIAYIEGIENETYSTTINSPVTYYKVSGTRCNETTVKTKEIIQPKEIGKACSLQLELGELSITASYSSNPSIKHPLFINKRSAKMTHNGCSGPGLELRSTSQDFLRTFSIEYHSIAGSSDYVIPDLIWGADETAGYGHNGEIFSNTNEIIKIEGIKCDIDKLPKPIASYQQALEIKTYIKTIAKDR